MKIEEINNHKGRVNTFIYDKQGNEVYSKNSNGLEEWYEYDEKGNEIHYKNSDGGGKYGMIMTKRDV